MKKPEQLLRTLLDEFIDKIPNTQDNMIQAVITAVIRAMVIRRRP